MGVGGQHIDHPAAQQIVGALLGFIAKLAIEAAGASWTRLLHTSEKSIVRALWRISHAGYPFFDIKPTIKQVIRGGVIVTLTQIAKYQDLSTSRITPLVKELELTKDSPLDDIRTAYIRKLPTTVAGRQGGDGKTRRYQRTR